MRKREKQKREEEDRFQSFQRRFSSIEAATAPREETGGNRTREHLENLKKKSHREHCSAPRTTSSLELPFSPPSFSSSMSTFRPRTMPPGMLSAGAGFDVTLLANLRLAALGARMISSSPPAAGFGKKTAPRLASWSTSKKELEGEAAAAAAAPRRRRLELAPPAESRVVAVPILVLVVVAGRLLLLLFFSEGGERRKRESEKRRLVDEREKSLPRSGFHGHAFFCSVSRPPPHSNPPFSGLIAS